MCVGGIDKRQINKDHLEEFPIITPPIELQNDFVDKRNLIEGQREKALRNQAQSKELFHSLIQKAFSGEL